MPLTYLLYRCPACGHDPTRGQKDQAFCPQCGVRFSRGEERALIRMEAPSGEVRMVPAQRLTAVLEVYQDRDQAEAVRGERPWHSATARMRRSGEESPVRWGGELLGFAEAMGEPAEGILELSSRELVFRPSVGSGSGTPGDHAHESLSAGDGAHGWKLLDIRAVQTSSSTVQFSPVTGGLVEFRFLQDSPFRWEYLLRSALRAAYEEEGLGDIVEFQPRIVVG